MHPARTTIHNALVIALLSVSMAGASAQAATTSSTFNVTATVNNACTVSGTTLAFGAYDPTSVTNLDATSTVSVLCTADALYKIGLDKGLHGGNTTSRQLTNGVDSLNYALYRDASRTLNWGENLGVDTVDDTGTGTTQSFTVYGRIAASQNVQAGSYTDTITISVNF
jgi:spore coat protein U-like protein